MHKIINIELHDPYFRDYEQHFHLLDIPSYPQLDFNECKYILENTRRNISLEDALNVIVSNMYFNKTSKIVLDIDERNHAYIPAKEMTIEEIENKLGHKIKIVNSKKGE